MLYSVNAKLWFCFWCQYYAFSTFAMHLNELEKGMEGVIPPTDSRLRPDIRAMENGDIGAVPNCNFSPFHTLISTRPIFRLSVQMFTDLSSAEKKRLEEKQRIARKNRSKSSEEWKNRFVTILHSSIAP